MKPVVFHPDAEAEFRAAVEFYDRQRFGLGAEFVMAVERAVRWISRMPQAFGAYGNTGGRGYILRRFPYTVIYIELETVIWVAAVAHHRRRPGYWSHRLPT